MTLVLSSLVTPYHRGDHPHTVLIKYADDAALVGLATGGEEVHYHNNISRLVSKCDEDGLELNLAKTKELIVDFRRGIKEYEPSPSRVQACPLFPSTATWTQSYQLT